MQNYVKQYQGNFKKEQHFFFFFKRNVLVARNKCGDATMCNGKFKASNKKFVKKSFRFTLGKANLEFRDKPSLPPSKNSSCPFYIGSAVHFDTMLPPSCVLSNDSIRPRGPATLISM